VLLQLSPSLSYYLDDPSLQDNMKAVEDPNPRIRDNEQREKDMATPNCTSLKTQPKKLHTTTKSPVNVLVETNHVSPGVFPWLGHSLGHL
jgi:hypothetical protein